LMRPGVTGRAEREVGGAVGMGEMETFADPDGAMETRLGRRTPDGAGMPGKRIDIGFRYIGPVALLVRHEPHPVDAIVVVEAGDRNAPATNRKNGAKAHLDERVACG